MKEFVFVLDVSSELMVRDLRSILEGLEINLLSPRPPHLRSLELSSLFLFFLFPPFSLFPCPLLSWAKFLSFPSPFLPSSLLCSPLLLSSLSEIHVRT